MVIPRSWRTGQIGGIGRTGELLLVSALALTACEEGGDPRGPPPPTKVLVVGLDGYDWRVADPLLDAGRLPTLARLVERGSRSRLRTIAPVLSPVVWTSAATGVRPERHGILDFLATDASGERIPVTSNMRRVPALWNLVGDAGLDVGVVAWWATWPAEEVRGTLVSDRLAYQLFDVDAKDAPHHHRTHPPELETEIRGMILDASNVPSELVERFVPMVEAGAAVQPVAPATLEPDPDELRRLEQFRRALASTETYADVATHLLRTRPWDFFAVYFEGPDVASHLFMPFRPPRQEWIPETLFERYHAVVDRFYEYQDEVLARVLAEVDEEETTIVVLSDHGFLTGESRPPTDSRIGHGTAARWHRKYGVLVVAGPAIRAGARVEDPSVLDLTPTVLALLGLAVPEGLDGRVLEEALATSHLASHPIRYGAPPKSRRADTTAVPQRSPEDQRILEKLATLGYIGSSKGDGAGAPEPASEGANTWNNRGSSLLELDRLADAEAAFRRALELEPRFVSAIVNLASSRLAQGATAEAESILWRATELDPRSAEIWNLLGGIALDRGDLADAETRFLRGLEADPGHVRTINSLANLYDEAGRVAEASDLYQRTVEIDPDLAEAWTNLGNLSRRAGDVDGALAHYRRAIEADPAYFGAHNNLALLLERRGDLAGAADAYARALELEPDHPEVGSNLAALFLQLGRHDEARTEYGRIIEAHPDFAEAHNNLGVTLGGMGLFEEEESHYRAAIRIEPGYADAHHNLGYALLRKGALEEAETALVQALELKPVYPSAYVNLARLHQVRGEVESAERTLVDGIALSPATPVLHNALGQIRLQRGDRSGACAAWRASLATDSAQVAVRERLGAAGCP